MNLYNSTPSLLFCTIIQCWTTYCDHGKFLEFEFTGPVNPNTGQAPGIYVATQEVGSLDPVVESLFEDHFPTPPMFAAFVNCMQRSLAGCDCHLDGREVLVGTAVDLEEDGGVDFYKLSEDDTFGTPELLRQRAHYRHPLVVPGSELEKFLDLTHGTDLSGDCLARYVALLLNGSCYFGCLTTACCIGLLWGDSHFWFLVAMNVQKRLKVTGMGGAGAGNTERYFSLTADPAVIRRVVFPLLDGALWRQKTGSAAREFGSLPNIAVGYSGGGNT